MKYTVTSPVSVGKTVDKKAGEQELVTRELKPGDTIDLTPEEAWGISHALAEAPETPPGMDEDEAAALNSIRMRPDNPASGVMLHWQADGVARAAAEGKVSSVATKEVGHGFERANAGSLVSPLAGPGLAGHFARPSSNMTEMEKKDAPVIAKAEKELNDRAAKRAGRETASAEGKPASAVPTGEPARPPVTRPAPPPSGGSR